MHLSLNKGKKILSETKISRKPRCGFFYVRLRLLDGCVSAWKKDNTKKVKLFPLAG